VLKEHDISVPQDLFERNLEAVSSQQAQHRQSVRQAATSAAQRGQSQSKRDDETVKALKIEVSQLQREQREQREKFQIVENRLKRAMGEAEEAEAQVGRVRGRAEGMQKRLEELGEDTARFGADQGSVLQDF